MRTGEEIELKGHIERLQQFRRHALIWVRVLEKGKRSVYQTVLDGQITDLHRETYIGIKGVVHPLPEGKTYEYPFEIKIKELKIIAPSDPEFASKVPQEAKLSRKLQQKHIWLRSKEFSDVTKFRTFFVRAIRKWCEKTGTVEIFPPSFVGSQCEGGATLFSLDYPKRDEGETTVYLTQSSQFYLEMAVPAHGDVFCIAPSFRKERSKTRRHLTEFLHFEVEWKDIMSLEHFIEKLREMLVEVFSALIRVCEKDGCLVDYPQLVQQRQMCQEAIQMTHQEAIQWCQDHEIWKDPVHKIPFSSTDDIPEAQEREMIDRIGKVVFLTRFHASFKSFYMKRDPEDPERVWGVDVEFPGVGECVGSGVRESDLGKLVESLKKEGLKEEDYKEYLDLRRWGFSQTGGFGMGVDRMLTWILGKKTIREVVTFPRAPGLIFP